MRANLDKRTNLYTLENEPNAPSFIQFVAGIGYLDPKGKDHYGKHWFVVVGESEGHEYHIQTAESSNDLEGLAKSLTEWKDDLCIQRIYLDATDVESLRFLRGYGPSGWDGLATYKSDGKNIVGKEKWIHKPDFWPHFRSRETIAHIVPVPDSIRVNLNAGYDLLLALEKADRVKYRAEALMVATVRREEKRDDVINHPLLQTLTWTISMLERTRPDVGGEIKQPKPRYGNMPR
jgi:hypothetical protein